MNPIAVDYHGVHRIGPEGFSCLLLRWPETGRVLPLWIAPSAAALLDDLAHGRSAQRPRACDVLAEVIAQATSGASGIEIAGGHEGVFFATIELADGSRIDARPSDAVSLAILLDLPVRVEEEVLAHFSVRMTAADLERQFGIAVSDPEPGEDPHADSGEDFVEIMRQLGVDVDDMVAGWGDDARPGATENRAEDAEGDTGVDAGGAGARPEDPGPFEGDDPRGGLP